LICRNPAFAAGATLVTGGTQEKHMLDIMILALGFGFFAAAIGYTYACERL
jgi:hypothetical protein